MNPLVHGALYENFILIAVESYENQGVFTSPRIAEVPTFMMFSSAMLGKIKTNKT